jgi:DNA-binding LacI/PurR family transcriptional regulator
MTGNDVAAFGVMRAIQERGLTVGEDVAVGGFDDIPAAEYIHPGLTTIHQPIFEIGQQLMTLLLQLLNNETVATRAHLIDPELVIRSSSGSQRKRQ